MQLTEVTQLAREPGFAPKLALNLPPACPPGASEQSLPFPFSLSLTYFLWIAYSGHHLQMESDIRPSFVTSFTGQNVFEVSVFPSFLKANVTLLYG